LSASITLADTPSVPPRTKTLPPLRSPTGSPTERSEPPSSRTGPKAPTVGACPARGSTGTSPGLAAAATCTVPPGASRVPPLIVTGPPTSPSVPGTGPSVAPVIVTGRGLGPRNPKAAGGAAVRVLASGLVAWKRAPSWNRRWSAVLAWKLPETSTRAFGPNTMPAGLTR
jgi:hypothetical protein